MSAPEVNRVVVVHGPADPILTYTLDVVGLEVVKEVGDVTVWAPRQRLAAVGFELPTRAPDYPLS